MPHIDPATFRNHFAALDAMVQLSSCSLGTRSDALDCAMRSMLDTMSAPSSPWHQFEEQVSEAREKFAKLIGARPDQVAIMPNASVGAYQVASTFNWRERPVIVTSSAEFPSIVHVWLAQKSRGARLKYTDTPQKRGYENKIDAQTGLVSVPMVSYSESLRLPIAEITEIAHEYGAKVFVDAYQTVGVEPVDVNRLNCDYLVAGTMKYLLGLPGVAFIYVRSVNDDDCLPQLTGWFGRADPFAFDPRTLDFAEDARRYETGTPSVPSLYAANAGLDLILDLDMDAVRKHVSDLVGYAYERLADQGEELRVAHDPEERGAHIALIDPDPEKLQAYLALRNITVSPRGSVVRLSFHYYNTHRDADAASEAIADYRKVDRGQGSACGHGSATKNRTRPDKETENDRALARLAVWSSRPAAESFPFGHVIDAYHRHGKHFVDEVLLVALDNIRSNSARVTGPDELRVRVQRFLDVVLDKFDHRYDYTTYCALSLLPLPTNPGAVCDAASAYAMRDRQLIQLVADFLQFELNARHSRTSLLPDMRPERSKFLKRIRLGLNSARFFDPAEWAGYRPECRGYRL